MKTEKRRSAVSREFAKQLRSRSDRRDKGWTAESCHARTSLDLKRILLNIAEEDYQTEKEGIERGLDRYRALIPEVARVNRFDLAIWIEGSDIQFQRDERDLSFLERAYLVQGELKYTHHNAYREYQLTRKGIQLATKLSNEETNATTKSRPNS